MCLLILSFSQCKKTPILMDPNTQIEIPANQLSFLEASEQRPGDPDAGKTYLFNGDYVDSGIPLEIFNTFYGNAEFDLDREGINQGVDHSFNAFVSANGVELASPNCFQCHASVLDGELVVGLGNINGDFSTNQSSLNNLIDQVIVTTYGNNSPEFEAYQPFSKALSATGPFIQTETIGSNPADKIAALLAGHRNPETLEWIEEDQLDVPNEVIPTDVPPWWNLKKKNAMFYTGVGRGDFARISMASSVLTIKDTIKAREIDNRFADVIAYINSLTPPPYTQEINAELADIGANIFEANCSGCHGTYLENENYPNLLVDLDLVQTDSALVYANFGFERFTDWYNNSWFGQEPHAAKLVAERGYVAQPLDGIWATAPYLHNGSVPDLRSLLDSQTRPDIWRRVEDNYNHENVGWEYVSKDSKQSSLDYDTSLLGYGNGGHTFGDHLTADERDAVLEYLKQL